MTAPIKNGGPAFPTVVAKPQDFPDGASLPLGMNLRDYVAIHTDLTKVVPMDLAIATKLLGVPMPRGLIESTMWQFELMWRLRFMSADAMLRQREVQS